MSRIWVFSSILSALSTSFICWFSVFQKLSAQSLFLRKHINGTSSLPRLDETPSHCDRVKKNGPSKDILIPRACRYYFIWPSLCWWDSINDLKWEDCLGLSRWSLYVIKGIPLPPKDIRGNCETSPQRRRPGRGREKSLGGSGLKEWRDMSTNWCRPAATRHCKSQGKEYRAVIVILDL